MRIVSKSVPDLLQTNMNFGLNVFELIIYLGALFYCIFQLGYSVTWGELWFYIALTFTFMFKVIDRFRSAADDFVLLTIIYHFRTKVRS